MCSGLIGHFCFENGVVCAIIIVKIFYSLWSRKRKEHALICSLFVLCFFQKLKNEDILQDAVHNKG